MQFGIHNPSFIFGPDPAEAFDALKAKAQWAETHGFTWFSVMDHLIQIPLIGDPNTCSGCQPAKDVVYGQVKTN